MRYTKQEFNGEQVAVACSGTPEEITYFGNRMHNHGVGESVRLSETFAYIVTSQTDFLRYLAHGRVARFVRKGIVRHRKPGLWPEACKLAQGIYNSIPSEDFLKYGEETPIPVTFKSHDGKRGGIGSDDIASPTFWARQVLE